MGLWPLKNPFSAGGMQELSHEGNRPKPAGSREEGGFDGSRRRLFVAAGLVMSGFAGILIRLWHLQVQNGGSFAQRADQNRVRRLEVAAPRGAILDRHEREIVANRPSFNVIWTREQGSLPDEVLKKLARALKVDVSQILDQIRRQVDAPRHMPLELHRDVPWHTVAYVESNRMELPGIKIDVTPRRLYPRGSIAAHVLGYLGEINKKEILQHSEQHQYRPGDQVGKTGLEKLQEHVLRGEKGSVFMEVDSLGFEQRNLNRVAPLPGRDLQLTIDLDLQQLIEQHMVATDKLGAVVAMEVHTGKIITMVSAPTYDLERFSGGVSSAVWKELNSDKHKPLLHRAVAGEWPPGSTFKIVTALAGLSEGVITPESVKHCNGAYHFANRDYHCWRKGGHGTVNLRRALCESCDVYFYQVGLAVGVDRLANYAQALGLGNSTKITMDGEKPGLIPTSSWKKKTKGEKWYEGETLSLAIGQGYNKVTPLQMCSLTAILANGGTRYRPQLIEAVRQVDGTVVERFEPEILSRLEGKGHYLRLIREGLTEAVNNPRGTGKKARLPGITVAGKTGTAQVVRLEQYKHLKEDQIPWKFRDHAWFTCFAPAENPVIAVTAFVEHGLHGGTTAAEAAHALLAAYFAKHPRG